MTEYEVYDPAFYECACGEVEYECELCGYHGHDCPLEED